VVVYWIYAWWLQFYVWLIVWKYGESFYFINKDSQVGYVETLGSLVGCGRGATH
jgi:hypothetical protein